MKKFIVILLVLAFLVVACAGKTTVQQVSTGGEAKTTTTAPAASAQQPATAQAATPDADSLKQAGLDCLKENVRVCLPVNYALAKVGDTVGFAFGVRNEFPDLKNIAIKVRFLKTQQSLGEVPIDTDKDYMNQWLSVNNFDAYYSLQQNDKLPVLIKVKDLVAAGTPTPNGAYVFEIQAQTYNNGFYDNYGGSQQVTVRIK